VSRLHIADTGLFVAMGQPSNSHYQTVRRFARRNDITFVLPERVYEELTVDDPGRGVRASLRFTDVGVEERFEWDASGLSTIESEVLSMVWMLVDFL
jgi:hypothetical protein